MGRSAFKATSHALERGEVVKILFRGQTSGDNRDGIYVGVIRHWRRRFPVDNTQVDIWVLPTADYEAYNKQVTIRGRRQPFVLKDVQGLHYKWPGKNVCRFCQSRQNVCVCPGARCPWQHQYGVCEGCRAGWAGGVCEGCTVVADADALEHLALERAQLIFTGLPKQELVHVGVFRGWSIFKAQRILDSRQAKQLKGLWPEQLGISALVIKPNTIVVTEGGDGKLKLVLALISAPVLTSVHSIEKEIRRSAKPSKPCGSKGGKIDVREWLSGRYNATDGSVCVT